jgi:hypothetical protein
MKDMAAQKARIIHEIRKSKTMANLIEVIARSHFSDTRIGTITRKMRVRIPENIAADLESLNLVTRVNPPPKKENFPIATPEPAGADQSPVLSPAAPALPNQTATSRRRGRPRKNGESSPLKILGD